jgi:alkylation response protein AidB-like acyl-CoA dehydrogenase
VIAPDFPAPTLHFGPEEDALRARVRSWLDANDLEEPPARYDDRIDALIRWQAQLHAAGFMGLSWPKEHGGAGLGLAAEAVLAEELARSGMPELINRTGVYMIGPTLVDFATEAQIARFLPPMLDATELWCQGFSEPEAGSDLAAVRTMARRDGDDLVVTGQKVWTTRASISRWCALLVRTDADAPRHRGLSMLIVDMRSPGITLSPLPQILNEPHFNEVFFSDVRVPVANVVGELGQGWPIAMKMLSYERGLFVLERQIRLQRRLHELTDLLTSRGRIDRPGVIERLASVHCNLTLLEAQVYRTLASQHQGTLRNGATSVDKLLMSHVYQELFAAATDLLGADVALTENTWTHDLLESRSTGIYGGTTEIQLNIVSSQLLGLGRST